MEAVDVVREKTNIPELCAKNWLVDRELKIIEMKTIKNWVVLYS